MWEAIAGYAVGRLHEKKVVNDDSLYAQKVLTTQLSYALENPDVFEDEIIDEIGLALSEFSDYLMLIYAGVITLNEYSENELISARELLIELCAADYSLKDLQDKFSNYKSGDGERIAKKYFKEANDYFNKELRDEWGVIFQSITLIALIDDEITENEIKYLKKVAKAFKIQEDQADELILETKKRARSLVENMNSTEVIEQEYSYLENALEIGEITQEYFDKRKTELDSEFKFSKELRNKPQYWKSEEVRELENIVEELKIKKEMKKERIFLVDQIMNISNLIGDKDIDLEDLDNDELENILTDLKVNEKKFYYRVLLESKIKDIENSYGVIDNNSNLLDQKNNVKKLKKDYGNDFLNDYYDIALQKLLFSYINYYEDKALIKSLEEEQEKLRKELKNLS
jgi:hypothetical protein